MGYDRRYYLKKAFALFPGVVRPVSAPVFAGHYRARAEARGAARALLDAAVGLGFLAWVPWRARAVARRHGMPAGWSRRAAAIARRRFVDPNDLALFGVERAEALDDYIRRFEDAALNKRLNPRGWTAECVLADKRRFAERCAAAGLPHARTLAVVAGGQFDLLKPLGTAPLVAKPSDGEGGDGIRLFDGGIAPDALARALPANGSYVVQHRVAAHPDLAGLADFALPTVRVVTILNEAGAPEVVSATFRCAAVEGAGVDNMKAGGLIVPVDLDTGTLGVARKGYGGGDYPAHPVSGVPIAGRVLPEWPGVQALVRRAHAEAFADYRLIGWDVAMTPDGPLLIEGNGKPGVLMPQRAARQGLAAGRYGQLIAHHLAIEP